MDTATTGQALAEPLYARLLGSAWASLAEPVRHAHATRGRLSARGSLLIERGTHPLAALLAWLLRLPPPAPAGETHLLVEPCGDGERWVRTIGRHRLVTRQGAIGPQLLAERYGVLELRFELDPSAGGLVYRQRGAALTIGSLRLPLPAWAAPRVAAREDPVDSRRTHIAVRVDIPGLGLLVAYTGTMEVEEAT